MFGYVLLDCIQKESAFGTIRDGDGDECLEFIRGLRIFAKKCTLNLVASAWLSEVSCAQFHCIQL